MSEQSVPDGAAPAPGTYEIDAAASTVRFRTRAVFGLLPVHGTFAVRSGRITVADPPDGSSVDVVVSADSFSSGNRMRDGHVRSADFLDAAAHPEISFRAEGLDRSSSAVILRGRLTVRDVTRPVDVAVEELTDDRNRITARGTAAIDRYDFGLTRSQGMTGRHLSIRLDVVADR